MLHLPGPEGADSQLGTAAPNVMGTEASSPAEQLESDTTAGTAAAETAAAAAAPGAGLDAECGACGHLLCWRCGEEAHEPASCAQVCACGASPHAAALCMYEILSVLLLLGVGAPMQPRTPGVGVPLP